MNTSSLLISILTFLCIAGALGAFLFAATASSRAQASAAQRLKKRRVKQPEAAAPVAVVEPEASVVPEPLVVDEKQADDCICNVPHVRNPRFYGCEKLIGEIRSNLMAKSHVALVDDAQGMGGVGKTSVAVEYALRFSADYDLIWWIRASDNALISADLSRLATRLDLRVEDAGPNAIREAVRQTLYRQSRWLLIFDDAADAELVRSCIPPGESGHVLITSEKSDWWQFAAPITMPGFERVDSSELLLARCKSTNGAVASQLAHLMNDLPLALDQAIVHASKSRKSLADYLTSFRARKKLLVPGIAEAMDRSQVMTVTLSISLEYVKNESGAAVELLSLLGFVASEGLPVRYLKKALQDTSDFKQSLADEALFMLALETLQDNALVTVSNEHIYTHTLVRGAVRAVLDTDKRISVAHQALNLASNMFSFDSRDKESMLSCSLLFPHALAAVDYADELGVRTDAASSLLDEVSLYMRACGELQRSADLAYRALSIAEATFGSAHPRIAVCADTLGASLHILGDLVGARNQYERALKIDETAYGPNHPSVACRLGSVGDVLRELGEPDRARTYLERALKIAESTYGPDHANVAARSASLALALEAMGELHSAKKLFQRALKIDETIYGLTHPDVANRVHCLGVIFTKMGDPDQARLCFDRALRIEKSTYGQDHPRVAARVAFLGLSLEGIGDYEAARDCYEEALAIDEAVYGPSHPNLVPRIDNLGRVLEMIGNYPAARDYYLQALAIEEAANGSGDIKVAERAMKLGKVYSSMGDLMNARLQFEQAIEIHQNVYGPTAVGLVEDLTALSDVLRELGDTKNARMQLGRALLISQEKLGLSHPHTEGIRKTLATFAY